MKRIDYNQLARGLVIRWIQRNKEKYILEEDLIGGEDKRRILEEIDKIINDLKQNRAEYLQQKIDSICSLEDCNEEFELWGGIDNGGIFWKEMVYR